MRAHLLGALAAVVALTGCTISPDLPQDAELIYHGYANGMKGALPGNVGRVYVVDTRTGKVDFVTYIKDDPNTPAAPSVKFSGLKTDRKDSFYFEPMKTDATSGQ